MRMALDASGGENDKKWFSPFYGNGITNKNTKKTANRRNFPSVCYFFYIFPLALFPIMCYNDLLYRETNDISRRVFVDLRKDVKV